MQTSIQLRQSVGIVRTTHNQTTTTEVSTSISTSSHQDGETLVRVIQSFQSLSLSNTQPLDSKADKMCKLFLKRRQEKLNQPETVKEFKETLVDLLNDFAGQITESTNSDLIKALRNDLNNKNLTEVFTKYYTHITIENQTLLSHLAPYLGDKDKIQKLAEKEAELLPTTIQSHMEFVAANRDDLMALFIKRKKNKNPALNCYIIDISDLSTCIEGLKKLKHSLPSGKSQRIQLLVRNDFHYTAVDIELSKTNTQSAVMDAGGDPKCKEVLSEIKNLDCQSVYALGLRDRIQFDRTNCAFFSFDSVCQSSKDPDFFAFLSKLQAEKQDGCKSLAWQNTPPSYVRNASSLAFMTEYHKSNPSRNAIYKDNETFESYIKKHTGKREIKGNIKDAHTVLEDKVNKQRPKIERMLKELPARELYDIMNHYSAQALLSNILKQN